MTSNKWCAGSMFWFDVSILASLSYAGCAVVFWSHYHHLRPPLPSPPSPEPTAAFATTSSRSRCCECSIRGVGERGGREYVSHIFYIFLIYCFFSISSADKRNHPNTTRQLVDQMPASFPSHVKCMIDIYFTQ